MRKFISVIILFIFSLELTGCIKPYVPNIQQGNIIEQNKVDRLKVGMSKEEVKEILGDPVLNNVFNRNCWVYAYTDQINGGKIKGRNLTICFNNEGRLMTIRNNSRAININ